MERLRQLLPMRLKMHSAERSQDYVTATQAMVNTMANAIGVESVAVIPPQRFLNNPLGKIEKERLDNQLGLEYAAESVRFQDQMMGVEIRESGERMVSLPDLFAQEGVSVQFSTKPFHAACGDWAGKPRVFWVREQVAQRLLTATRALNAIGLTLTFQDGFRPVGVQEGLFKRRITDFVLPNHPDWTWDQVLLEARSKTGINPIVSGHKGGAAVDATLSTLDGTPLPLGNEYPEGGAMVALNFPYLTEEQWRTRQLFAAAMKMAGLKPYEGEDWHASFGDNLAASGEHYVARYGPIKGFDPETGEVDPYDPSEYEAPFYTEAELRAIANK